MRISRPIFSLWALILFFFFLGETKLLVAQSSGLRFIGQGHSISERSSLELFPKKPFSYSNQLSIEFDLSFVKGDYSYFGYIFRMFGSEGVKIDMIYEDLHDPLKQNKLIILVGKNQLLFSLPVPLEYLYSWKHVKIDLDILNGNYVLRVGDLYSEVKGDFLPLKGELEVFFGSIHKPPNESSDLPNMKIRDIRMEQDYNSSRYWPLNDLEGTSTRDNIKKSLAHVENPYWLYQEHSTWGLVHQLSLKGDAQCTYDRRGNRFFVVTRDSLFSFIAGTGDSFTKTGFRSPINLLRGHHLIYDSIHGNLLRYSIEQRMVVKYEAESNNWENDIPEMEKLTAYWHHNKIILPQDSSLYLLGGYGHHTYKNSLLIMDLVSGSSDSTQFDREVFGPRYLAGLGANSTCDTLYILGGYGTLMGDQKYDPHYWYELLRFVPSHQKMERLFTYDQMEESGFCFANSFVIRGDSYYALAYSKFNQSNTLQLYKGSLHTNHIEAVGDKVPYIFREINSFTTEAFVDLFYSEQDLSLYAVVSYFHENEKTDIKIFELRFPPKDLLADPVEKEEAKTRFYLLLGLSLLILLIGIALYVNRKKLHVKSRKNKDSPSENKFLTNQFKFAADADHVKARVLLFGGFQVLDDHGKDITGLFTPTLREMFLLIFLNSFGDEKGLSSKRLKKILWSDKNDKDAANNSSVNLSRLKAIISNLGDSSISKETGYLKIHIDYAKVYVDYAYLYNIVRTSSPSQKMIYKLIEITRRCPFLKNIDEEWVDPIRTEVINYTLDTLNSWAKSNAENSDPADMIPLADAVLECDPMDEDAIDLKCTSLVKLGKHSLAKSTYNDFVEEYKLLYGEEFKISFKDLVT